MFRRHYRYFASAAILCGTFALLPLPAWGQAQYNVSATAINAPTEAQSSPSPIASSTGLSGISGDGPPYGTLLEYGADSANPGYTQAQGNTTVQQANYGSPGPYWAAGGYAQFMCNDMVVSGPANPSGVPIILNFELDGNYSVTNGLNNAGPGLGDYDGNSQSISNVSLSLGILGGNYQGSFSAETQSAGDGTPEGETDSNFGLFASYGGMGKYDFTLGPLTVPVNSPFSLSNELTVGSSWEAEVSGTGPEEPNFSGAAVADYSVAFQSIAATLPDGYTLNSAEANIVNDVYTAPVPEPGTLSLLLSLLPAALLGVVYLRRRSANR